MDRISYKVLAAAYKRPISYEMFGKLTQGDSKGESLRHLCGDNKYLEVNASGFSITRAGRDKYEELRQSYQINTLTLVIAVWGAVTATVLAVKELLESFR